MPFWRSVSARVAPRHRAGRLKQWLNLLRRRFPEAQALYDRVRTLSDPRAVEALLGSGPDLVGHLDHQTQLVALVLDRDVVAVHGAAEAALG